MPATIEDLDFIAPGLAGVPPEAKEKAIARAAAYRPGCLPEDMQDEAQLYYAAWLLFDRERQLAVASSGAGAVGYGAKSIKEGDVAIEFFARADGSAVLDPQGFYQRWSDLNAICAMGSITVSTWSPHNGCGC